jgi:hypothetical protein
VPWFTKILAKDVPLQISIGWTRQAGRLLNLPLPIGKIHVARVLMVNSAICYISAKLKSEVARVQKDPAKITISVPVKV